MSDEKSPSLSRSEPPRAPLTEVELLIVLDRLSRDVKGILNRLEKAEENDRRFERLEHDFRIAKWFSTIAVGATVIALVNGIAGRVSWHVDPAPVPASNAERMGSDRVQHDAGRP